jgi:hypothetical protein
MRTVLVKFATEEDRRSAFFALGARIKAFPARMRSFPGGLCDVTRADFRRLKANQIAYRVATAAEIRAAMDSRSGESEYDMPDYDLD